MVTISWKRVPSLAALFTVTGTIIPTPVKREVASQLSKRATCTPVSAGDSSVDDAPAIIAAIKSCGNGGTIVIPSGIEYQIRSPVTFTGCANCIFQVDGILKASDDVEFWATESSMFSMTGITGAQITSSTGEGLFDGNGQASYDEFAVNSSLSRPTLLEIAGSTGITVSNLHFRNAPNVFHSANDNSKNIVYSSITMSAASSSTNAPKNTDGWDIGPATDVIVSSVKVTNQDDCIAFKTGANFVTVTDITCIDSHGLSVGSLGGDVGQTDTVSNIIVSGATMINATKASGLKLWPGGFGTAIVTNVTYENVVSDGCEYAAQIQSCYDNTAAYCTDNPSTAIITDVNWISHSGTTSGNPVAMFDCPAAGTCGINLENWTVEPASGGSAEFLCANIESSAGVTCTSGATG